MPARSVDEINISNFEQLSVDPPRAQFDLEVKWTSLEGQARQHNGLYIWPDAILPGGTEVMPAAVWQEFITQMITAGVRVNRGIDEWGMYT